MNDYFNVSDYVLHWWKGDAGRYYRFIGLEVSQANKLFKFGLYLGGLAAFFELYKFESVLRNLKESYYTFAYSLRLFRGLTSFINIGIRLFLMPVYFAIAGLDDSQKMTLPELWKYMFKYHFESADIDAHQYANRKSTYRMLCFMQNHPPTDRQIKLTVLCSFSILAIFELLTG